jgi:hypothetical protein
VQHRGRPPARARLAQLVLALVVAGDEDGGRLDHDEHVDELGDAAPDRAEVARGDEHVRVARHVGDQPRPVEVAMDVAECEQPHGAAS